MSQPKQLQSEHWSVWKPEIYCDGIWPFARQRLGKHLFPQQRMLTKALPWLQNRGAIRHGDGPEKDYAGEGQQHIQKTDSPSRKRGRPRKPDHNCQSVITKTYWWLTVSRNDLEFEPSERFRQEWEISQRFVIEIRQTAVVQKEFNVWAVIINYNCKEVPINPIMKSITRYC
jgi:hypothetical protein